MYMVDGHVLKLRCARPREDSWRYPMLGACDGYMKTELSETLPLCVWGSIWRSLHQACAWTRNQERRSTWRDQDSHHLAQVECSRQRYDLDRFSFLPVSCSLWRPGYRIDRRTIKRGSRVSNLIAYLWRAQTFAYLTYHLPWLLFGFYLCEDLELSPSSY